MTKLEIEVVGEKNKEKAVVRRRLLEKAEKGDQAACDALWKMMEEDSTAESFVASLTSTAVQLRQTQHEHLLIREAFRRKMEHMRERLGWKMATALERLLIDRIVICWNHLHRAELRQAEKMQQSPSLDAATYFDKAVDRAHKRYLAAIHSLAVVRRLQLPAMQVNIGEKQINVMQSGPQAQEVLPLPQTSASLTVEKVGAKD